MPALLVLGAILSLGGLVWLATASSAFPEDDLAALHEQIRDANAAAGVYDHPLTLPRSVSPCADAPSTPSCAVVLLSRCIAHLRPELCDAVGRSDVAASVAAAKSDHGEGSASGLLPLSALALDPPPTPSVTPDGVPVRHASPHRIESPRYIRGVRPVPPARFVDPDACETPVPDHLRGTHEVMMDDLAGIYPVWSIFVGYQAEGWHVKSLTFGPSICAHDRLARYERDLETWHCRLEVCASPWGQGDAVQPTPRQRAVQAAIDERRVAEDAEAHSLIGWLERLVDAVMPD